jgi:uridine kinase
MLVGSCVYSPTHTDRSDHPDSMDMELFAKCIVDLKKGRATEVRRVLVGSPLTSAPVYSFVHHRESC